MTTIAIANQKGGVGKTTLAVHLAEYLYTKNKNVLLVDADPQGNATTWLTGATDKPGIFQLLVAGVPASHTLEHLVPDGNQYALLPGNARSAEAYIFLAATGKPISAIAQYLAPLTSGPFAFDYILIDLFPSTGPAFREYLYAADWVLCPTQLERHALEGVAYMARTCQDIVAQHKRGPRLLGIVPNMARATTNEHQAQMRELIDTFGQAVWPPIPASVRIAEAAAYGTTVFRHAPKGPAARALQLIGERLITTLEANHARQ